MGSVAPVGNGSHVADSRRQQRYTSSWADLVLGVHTIQEAKKKRRYGDNETWRVKTAVGLEWIVDARNTDKGIVTVSDQMALSVGLAFANTTTGLVPIPLNQHYASYNDDIDTAMRLIALQPLADGHWAKLDLKVPYDWRKDAWPSTAEIQLATTRAQFWFLC